MLTSLVFLCLKNFEDNTEQITVFLAEIDNQVRQQLIKTLMAPKY